MLREVKALTTMAAIQTEIFKFFQAYNHNKLLQEVQLKYHGLCQNDERLIEIEKHRQIEQTIGGLQQINMGLYTYGISEPQFSKYKQTERRETRQPYYLNQRDDPLDKVSSADDDEESFKPTTKRRKTESMDYRLTKPFHFGKSKVSRTEVKSLLIDNSKLNPNEGKLLPSIAENNEPLDRLPDHIVLSENSSSFFLLEKQEPQPDTPLQFPSKIQKSSFVAKNVIQSSSSEGEKPSELTESIEAESPSMEYAQSPSLEPLREFASEDHYCIGLATPPPAQIPKGNQTQQINLTPSKHKLSTPSSKFQFIAPPKQNILESTGTSEAAVGVEKGGAALSSWDLQSKIVQKAMLQEQKTEKMVRSFGKPMENIPLLLQKRTYLERQF